MPAISVSIPNPDQTAFRSIPQERGIGAISKLRPDLRRLYMQASAPLTRGLGSPVGYYTSAQLRRRFGIADASSGAFVAAEIVGGAPVDTSTIDSLGATPIMAKGRVVIVLAPIGSLADLASMRDVLSIDAVDVPSLPGRLTGPAVSNLRSEVRFEGFNHHGLTGKGVAIGVISTGVDWSRPDFRRPDGSSRIRVLWDMLDDSWATSGGKIGTRPPIFVAGKPVGTVYTRDQIDAGLRGKGTVNSADSDGYGTACAIAAAGSSRRLDGAGCSGVAPMADLIVVKAGQGERVSAAYLAGASWIADEAASIHEPVVIDQSFACPGSSLGGSTAEETVFGGIVGSGIRGVAICAPVASYDAATSRAGRFGPVAGGTAENSGVGIRLVVRNDTPIRATFDSSDEWGLAIAGTHNYLISDDGKPDVLYLEKSSAGIAYELRSPAAAEFNLEDFLRNRLDFGESDDGKTDQVIVKLPPGAYVVAGFGSGPSVPDGRIEVTLPFSGDAVFGGRSDEHEAIGNRDETHSEIAVGADITAPDPSYVAGVIALLLQSNPTLDQTQIRAILARTARNGRGSGRINPAAALAAAHRDFAASNKPDSASEATTGRIEADEKAARFDDASALVKTMPSKTAIEAADRDKTEAELNMAWGLSLLRSARYRDALDHFETALALDRKGGNADAEAKSLELIGVSNRNLGVNSDALSYYRQSLAAASRAHDVKLEADDLLNAGIALGGLGRYGEGLDSDRRSVELAESIGDLKAQERALGHIGAIYENLGQYDKALQYCQQSLALADKLEDETSELADMGNSGLVYQALGEYDKTLNCDRQVLELTIRMGDDQNEERSLSNIGTVELALGRTDQALDDEERALALATKIGDVSLEGADLANIGSIYDVMGQRDKAMASIRRAVGIAEQIGDVRGEEQEIDGIADIDDELGDSEKALLDRRQALIVGERIGDISGVADTLADLMTVEQKLNHPDQAIYYGKQSVNTYQTIRLGVANIGPAEQTSYMATVEKTYRQLADMLIDAGRLPEAERVLAMLKDQEAADFVERDSALSPAALTIGFDPLEQRADSGVRRVEDPVIAVGRELDALRALKQRTADQARRIVALSAQLDTAKAAYDEYVATDLPRELATSPDTHRPDVTDVSPIQEQLRAMGPGTVAVITLVEPNYLRLIVVTSQTQKAEVSAISAADLRRLVGRWRVALENLGIDPRPLGEKLASVLIGPIQADLNGARATTILFSLDDVLRFVPMAALYDGDGYVVEKYRVAVFTGATLSAPAASPSDWLSTSQSLLAMGVTKAHSLPDPETGKMLDFPALPGVGREIAAIARTTATPDGVLPGEALEDEQFTASGLQLGLAAGYPVVHIASHFDLGSKDTTSFLLLGDGSALTLDKLFHKGGQVFQGVDLLTLSACQTGEAVSSSDGRQFESLGMVAEAQGARSILASLWPVSDESTPLLMHAFYDKRANTSGMSKAEALREAQVAMIHGDIAGPSTQPTRGIAEGPSAADPDAPPFAPDPKAPYAHPFYWAPFVLLGGWQ
jgi:CHAT domain-containing protein/Tfp pilus assembly protein PilF